MRAVHIVWFKRDLRIEDHRPLMEAAAHGEVLPLYIVEPQAWRQPDASLRQWRFVRQTLLELDADLRALGAAGLVVRVGETCAVLAALAREFSVAGLWSHEETGNDWSFARDRAVLAWTKRQGVAWTEFRQDGVLRRLNSRNGWAEHWQRFMVAALIPAPAKLEAVDAPSDHLPDERALFADNYAQGDDCPHAQPGGRSHALRLLHSFLHVRGKNYARGMSSPLTAESACSRLSPHIAWGALSMREIVHALHARQVEAPEGWGRALAAFAARLAWQSHFMQKLESEPRMEFANLHPALAHERQSVDARLLRAWSEGRTGFPLIDACMRMLHATGWINFRMRAMLAAFACYHLWQPWREVGLHLARLFIDYEPGIHWSQMQMQSGSTGINAFRIYNPVKQSYDQDPEGVFIRRWLPELGRVPAEWVHEPWRMPAELQKTYACSIGQDYPAPIVDHEQAARAAREKLHLAYRGDQARESSRQVMEKHGSRKRRSRAPAPAKTSAQLDLFA
ncbi:MAG: FAD-binding domain-containing protein [Pseudomonadota bacterium]